MVSIVRGILAIGQFVVSDRDVEWAKKNQREVSRADFVINCVPHPSQMKAKSLARCPPALHGDQGLLGFVRAVLRCDQIWRSFQ